MNKTFKKTKIGIIIVDVLAIINLIYQIIIDDVSLLPLVTIILCNIIIFGIGRKKTNHSD